MKMSRNELTIIEAIKLVNDQKKFFNTTSTKSIDFRIMQLKKLKAAIRLNENRLLKALYKDLGKHPTEAYTTEIGFVYKSISDHIKKLRGWSEPKLVPTPIYLQPARSYVIRESYGSVLIIGPYNYPFQLLIEPLIGAISAGNCAVLKPSELTPTVANIVSEIINTTFRRYYIHCVEGTVETNTSLLNVPFDYIFFTGSQEVGKIVMKAAANNLIPVTLELGGKSPVIVDETANLREAATRIAWGKAVNAGQTCVAPDYVYVHENVKKEFLRELKSSFNRLYGKDIKLNKNYGKIVNHKHFERLMNILRKDQDWIEWGGTFDATKLFLEPTILLIPDREAASMQEEIFGPILPILTYIDIKDVIKEIKLQPKPLALYLFSQNSDVENKVLNNTSSGGVCINDTITHVANPYLPFGGIGSSGIGSYHGKQSYLTFSHNKSILKKGNINITIAYPAYTKKKLNIIKMILK
jgi:aldehyde dehydrogenase (NAD+)